MVKAVLLDVDGTLFDTERLFGEGWLLAGEEMGVPLTYGQALFFHGKGQAANIASFHEWFGERADYMAMRDFRQAHTENYIKEHGVPLKEGLFEFLSFCKDNGILIALASGTPRMEGEPRWEKAGIIPYIDASVSGDEVENSKPHPEIFMKAADQLGIAYSECLVIEDSHAGLRAGRAAACQTLMLPDMEPATDDIVSTACDYVRKNLFEAIILIKELNGIELS